MTKFSKLLTHTSLAALLVTAAAFSAPALADGSPECNGNGGPDGIAGNTDDPIFSTECGAGSSSSGNASVAVGWATNAAGPGSTAVGAKSEALGDGSTALGHVSRAIGEQGTAAGKNSAASGYNSSAYGYGARAGGDGGISDVIGNNVPNRFENAGATALGAGARAGTDLAGQENATAVGAGARANALNGSAFGAGSSALFENSVALGQGSETDRTNSVSVGQIGAERQITSVAAGTQATDAVNKAQLDIVATAADDAQGAANLARSEAAEALGEATTALGTANTARTEAAQAQTTADTAIVRGDTLGASTAAALGGGTVYNPATGGMSAPSYMIDGQNYADVGSALSAVDDHLGQIDTRLDVLSASTDRGFRQANGGIAAAIAIGGTMIVPDSTVSVNFNLATYRGEQGFSGAVVLRAAPRVYVSGGFAGSTVKGSTGGRVGMAFGF